MYQKCNRCKHEALLIYLHEPLCEYHWQRQCSTEQHIGQRELQGYTHEEDENDNSNDN